MSIPEQIGGLSLAQFVDLSARMIGLETAEQCYAVVREAGIEQAVWEAANMGWTQELARGDAEIVATHRRLLIEALRRVSGVKTPISFDLYVDLNAEFHAGVPPADALRSRSHNMQSFSAASYEWMDRFDKDPWLKVYFQLRLQKAIAERTNEADRQVCAVYGPGNLVRGRRCHSCGALKVTKPTTAYVYCDYCASLFDYDPWVAIEDPAALDPDMVDEQIGEVTKEQLQKAFEAGDREEYRRIVQWTSEVLTEICPSAYSPRIRDPEYRAAFNRNLIAPWAVATRFDADHAREGRAVDQAQRAALASRSLADILKLLELSKLIWKLEGDLLERTGILAAHPDGLDRDRYTYVNASVFVRPWLSILSEAEQTQLLDAAGVRCEYVPLPSVEVAERSCGNCRQKLSIPVGSKRFVCESCGFILEAGSRVFNCMQCGGSVCLPAAAIEAVCGYCGSRWTL